MIENVKGLREVQAAIRKFAKEKPAQASEAMMDIGLTLEAESKLKAPIDEGYLRSQSNVEDGKRIFRGYYVQVWYRAPYAHRMHEDMDYTPSEPGTGPKYLTGTLQKNAGKYRRFLTEKMKVR